MKRTFLLTLLFSLTFAIPASGKAAEEYEFVTMWPKLDQPWYFEDPRGIAVDSKGNVYIADVGTGIVKKFSSKGEFLAKLVDDSNPIGHPVVLGNVAVDKSNSLYVTADDLVFKFSSDGKLLKKWRIGPEDEEGDSIAIDPSGNVLVFVLADNTVYRFDPKGKLLTKWGSEGTGKGQFKYPYGMAADSKGNIYVADTRNNRIHKFASEGRFVALWGKGGDGKGEFYGPCDVAVDDSGNVYVADNGNGRIQKFTSEGKYLAQWQTRAKSGKRIAPVAIEIGPSGSAYVVDMSGGRVQKYDTAGKLLATWSSQGQGAVAFSSPSEVAVDTEGYIYVVDWDAEKEGGRIHKLDPDGRLIGRWEGGRGEGDGEFSVCTHIAFDKSGNVYIADRGNSRIQKFTSDRKFITKWGEKGEGPGQFDPLYDVAVDSKGNVYAASDTRIQKFSSDGKFIAEWGKYVDYDSVLSGEPGKACRGDGEFNAPLSLAIDSSDNVYVADFGNARVQKLDSNGKFIRKWGKLGIEDHQFGALSGIAVDSSGNVYVTNKTNQRVQKFSSDGKFITKWGSEKGWPTRGGDGEGEFNEPSGIAVDRDGNVYVADTKNNRIQIFRPKKLAKPPKNEKKE